MVGTRERSKRGHGSSPSVDVDMSADPELAIRAGNKKRRIDAAKNASRESTPASSPSTRGRAGKKPKAGHNRNASVASNISTATTRYDTPLPYNNPPQVTSDNLPTEDAPLKPAPPAETAPVVTTQPEPVVAAPVVAAQPEPVTAAETTPVGTIDRFPRPTPLPAALAASPDSPISADTLFDPATNKAELYTSRLPNIKGGIFSDNKTETWFATAEEMDQIVAPEYIRSGTAFDRLVAEATSKPSTFPPKIMNLNRPKTRDGEQHMRDYLSFGDAKSFRTWARLESKFRFSLNRCYRCWPIGRLLATVNTFNGDYSQQSPLLATTAVQPRGRLLTIATNQKVCDHGQYPPSWPYSWLWAIASLSSPPPSLICNC
jgi:hypothetical protein